MKNVTQKAVRWMVELIDRHVERQVSMRVYNDRRFDFGLKP